MSNEAEQKDQRQAKLKEIVELGAPAYPARFDRTDAVSALVDRHGSKTGEKLEDERPTTRTAGRILSIRSFGKATFLVVSDGKSRLQVYVREDSLRARDFTIAKRLDL